MVCYAEHLGNCNGGISKEHYVSRSVLEAAGGEIQVSGFPWQEKNETKKVGINSLVSKVLCSYHNSELSSLDASGSSFLEALRSIFNTTIEEREFSNEIFNLDGKKTELWLLKIFCGLLATSKVTKIPGRWVEILFEKELFPDGSGLHIFGETGRGIWFFNLVRVFSVQDTNSTNIAGAKFGIGGLAFLLAFGRPNFSESSMRSILRPDKLSFEKNCKTKEINFTWGEYQPGNSIKIRIEGLVQKGQTNDRPIVGSWQEDKR